MKKLIHLIIVAAASVPSYGVLLQVPGEYSIIQDAIDAAVDGDVIQVSPGEYEENISFSGKSIVVTSLDPNDPNVVAETIIFREPERSRRGLAVGTEGNGSIVTFTGGETPEAVLTGFTIQHGYGTVLEGNTYFGGGILCIDASPRITRNIITGNLGEKGTAQPGALQTIGGAICCIASPFAMADASRPSITHNVISDNTATQGAGICCIRTEAFVAYNTVTFNEAYVGGGIISVDGPTVVFSNLIIDNTADLCGGVWLRGGRLLNNTLVHNSATDICGHLMIDTQSLPNVDPQPVHIANNIFYGARAGGVATIDDQTDGVSFIHNSLFNNSPGDFVSFVTGQPFDAFTGQVGNILEDPLFVAASQGDYHLQDDSLCIDAGDPTFEPNESWGDMDGNPRISGAAVDMGMFESTRCTAPVAHAGADQVLLIGTEVILDGAASTFCDPNKLQMFIWDQSAGPSVRLSSPRAQQPSFTPELAGEYRFELMVFDGDNVSRADEVVITVLSEWPEDPNPTLQGTVPAIGVGYDDG